MGFVRRRARRRTVLVAGGAAYAAGKHAQQDSSDEEPAEEPVDQAQAQEATGEDAEIDELKRIADLHDSGALTDDEFEAGKAKVLGN